MTQFDGIYRGLVELTSKVCDEEIEFIALTFKFKSGDIVTRHFLMEDGPRFELLGAVDLLKTEVRQAQFGR